MTENEKSNRVIDLLDEIFKAKEEIISLGYGRLLKGVSLTDEKG